ncbi:collagen-like triple helix repeat-containing protein [Zobellia sp. B3R18]|uniref:collagen-like triple helix repeat-containing protein n=1 Tax=Zobellia sp. B3R18 TaxID=2841568 RepID=UPI001C066722|nr:collagen-like protein [Zobellia sp. B3R18]
MKLFTMLFLAMGITFTSCEGPEGPEGEMGLTGETGAQGEAGATGEQGAQGEPGEDGNANVIASDWMDTDFDNTPVTFTQFDIEIPNLTRAEINDSAVLVYLTDGVGIYQAPYVNFARNFYFSLRNNSETGYDMYITGSSMNGNSYTFDWMEEFRYVIIPQAASEAGKAAGMNFEKMSYEEVIDHFGLDY